MTHIEASRIRRGKAKAMRSLIDQGLSRREVGELFGCSRQRVQQIIKQAGV